MADYSLNLLLLYISLVPLRAALTVLLSSSTRLSPVQIQRLVGCTHSCVPHSDTWWRHNTTHTVVSLPLHYTSYYYTPVNTLHTRQHRVYTHNTQHLLPGSTVTSQQYRGGCEATGWQLSRLDRNLSTRNLENILQNNQVSFFSMKIGQIST